MKTSRPILICFCLAAAVCASVNAQSKRADVVSASAIYARIIQLEDERNLNGDELIGLLKHRSAAVRERVALAIGRIGDKRGANALIAAMREDEDQPVRAMAAFALGEIEEGQAVTPLLDVVNSSEESLVVRARAVEALGKIASIQANNEKLGQTTLDTISQSLIKQLLVADATLSADQKLLASLAITALMRLRNPASVEPLTHQLKSKDAEARAQAANALARLRQPIGSAVPALIEALSDSDANVRANAARALGASKDMRAVEPLVKMLDDESEQAQASAIRALASLGDKRATEALLALGRSLLVQSSNEDDDRPHQINLLFEIATAFGAIKDEKARPFLLELRREFKLKAPSPEIEVAVARLGEKEFFGFLDNNRAGFLGGPTPTVEVARGLGEICSPRARETLLSFLEEASRNIFAERALPEILRSLAKCKYEDLPKILRRQLLHKDVIERATAATLLADLRSDENLGALVKALSQARTDLTNDAKLAILASISQYKSPRAVAAVKLSLKDSDHLVRRRAVDLLRQMGAGDFSSRIGIVRTNHNQAFYQRLARRLDKKITVLIDTDKGEIEIDIFPQDAPITVDSFITLARKGYFNDLTFHRVVPNFVIQGGDPRGDGEGGPGYQIRCEINPRPYTRGAVGMALSGKDTGGSQFFITHSPQPHLDGGYTVFGQVTSGMEVVDRIVRGDSIRRIEIVETRLP